MTGAIIHAPAAPTLHATAPAVSPAAAIALAEGSFGLACTGVEVLTAERDQNLLLQAADDTRWVMKVTNPDEDRMVTDFQTAALRHLERADPGLPVPRLRPARSCAPWVEADLDDGRRAVVRVLQFFDGQPLATGKPSDALRADMAGLLARLDRAFAGFHHPGQELDLQWNSARLDRMAGLLPSVDDGESHALVAAVLKDFAVDALPALPGLRRQVIYNDLNFYNVLIDTDRPDRVSGLIDFGDIIAAPLVNDLAVAASYQFGADGNRDGALHFMRAYHRVLPLHPEEIALLPLLIEARLALTLLITGYRAARHPENAPYILRNNAPARRALAEMRAKSYSFNRDWAFSIMEGA